MSKTTLFFPLWHKSIISLDLQSFFEFTSRYRLHYYALHVTLWKSFALVITERSAHLLCNKNQELLTTPHLLYKTRMAYFVLFFVCLFDFTNPTNYFFKINWHMFLRLPIKKSIFFTHSKKCISDWLLKSFLIPL